MTPNVYIFNEQSTLLIDEGSVVRLVQEFLIKEKQPCHEVTIHFVDTPTICNLHRDYFNDPSTTDCISFPMDGLEEDSPYRILGEVFVCPETAMHYALPRGLNPYSEVALYVIHGLLHLIGFDDQEPKERAKMRRAEKKHMQHINSLNLTLKK